ncbi:MAG: sensor histidine kinase KdpD [Candidatus Omnitrophota bacterium]
MERPDPDVILAKVKAEESQRGKLKIFFGAVAGVGKTYSMLEAARACKKEGIDVVVGYVETHKRAETEALLESLEILPPKIISYKNVQLREFDIDAGLKRKPKLILVDELAHTNAPGSRHPKRWQDVQELLDQGIDVYTTLNVQHCESANDIVAQVTGVIVRETIPDTFIEQADEIELVDLPTEELLKRLKEGKVYLGEQAQAATEHFFQPGNLIALRQLALRYTERNVDSKLMSYKKEHAVSKVWNVRDRFLVCISPSPSAMGLIRAGKRIALDLGVEWIVAYVEPLAELRPEDKNRVSEMLNFAEKLGAQIVTLSGQDIVETLISYARSKNVTKIIIGKPGKPKLRELIFGSIFDKLARKCQDIDLYLLSGDTQEQPVKFKPPALIPFSWKNLGLAIGVVIICTLVDWILLLLHLSLVNLIMVYLLGVTWIAFRYGRRISMIASFFSVLFFDFFFVRPYFTFAVADVEYVFTFIVMLGVGLMIAHLTGQLRRQTINMGIREDRTKTLYALSHELSKSSYPDELFKIALSHIEDFFKCRAVIFVPDKNKRLEARFGEVVQLALDSNEVAVAQWVFEHKKSAGKGTDTLPGSNGMYLPFTGAEKTVGVLGVFPTQETQFVDPEQLHILEMFVNQTALAVEGAQLAAAALDAESRIENERLRNLLLTTFSSGLTEPLTSISQTASELLNPENLNNESKRSALIEKMRQETERLNTLIAELPQIIESEK